MPDYEELIISPKNTDGKGRAFRALKISAVMADSLWEMGSGDKHDRPVYATFAASENELRPFVANLLCGRPAASNSKSYRSRNKAGYEFMKSAGYKVIYQRHEAGSVATIFLPDLVGLDPGMVDPKEIKFVVVPGADYLAREAAHMPVDDVVHYAWRLPVVETVNEPQRDWHGHVYSHWTEPLPKDKIRDLVPLSYLFALYLSNRSRAPIPPDGRFYLQLLLRCLKDGLASFSHNSYGDDRKFGVNHKYNFTEEGVAEGKLYPGLAFWATHEQVEEALSSECALYFERMEK